MQTKKDLTLKVLCKDSCFSSLQFFLKNIDMYKNIDTIQYDNSVFLLIQLTYRKQISIFC